MLAVGNQFDKRRQDLLVQKFGLLQFGGADREPLRIFGVENIAGAA